MDQTYEFQGMKTGYNGPNSLYINDYAKAKLVADNRKEYFQDFKAWDKEVVGIIEGFEDVAHYEACASCGAKLIEQESCNNCRMPNPVASPQCRYLS